MNNFHNCMSDLDLWGGESIDPDPTTDELDATDEPEESDGTDE